MIFGGEVVTGTVELWYSSEGREVASIDGGCSSSAHAGGVSSTGDASASGRSCGGIGYDPDEAYATTAVPPQC